MQRGPASLVREVDQAEDSGQAHQELNHVPLVHECGLEQTGPVQHADDEGVGLVCSEQPEGGQVCRVDAPVDRRGVVLVFVLDVGPHLQQLRDGLEVLRLDREEERSHQVPVHDVGVGAVDFEHLDQLEVLLQRGDVQQAFELPLAVPHVDVESAVQLFFQFLQLAVLRELEDVPVVFELVVYFVAQGPQLFELELVGAGLCEDVRGVLVFERPEPLRHELDPVLLRSRRGLVQLVPEPGLCQESEQDEQRGHRQALEVRLRRYRLRLHIQRSLGFPLLFAHLLAHLLALDFLLRFLHFRFLTLRESFGAVLLFESLAEFDEQLEYLVAVRLEVFALHRHFLEQLEYFLDQFLVDRLREVSLELVQDCGGGSLAVLEGHVVVEVQVPRSPFCLVALFCLQEQLVGLFEVQLVDVLHELCLESRGCGVVDSPQVSEQGDLPVDVLPVDASLYVLQRSVVAGVVHRGLIDTRLEAELNAASPTIL